MAETNTATDAASVVDLTRPDAYGLAFADVYDRWYGADGSPAADDIEAMVDFVVSRCPSGIVVELGVGSGRLAAPLVAAGIRVIGLDASVPMLRRCPPAVHRVAGDIADLPLRFGRHRPTVLCGFNTIFNVGTADRLDRLLAAVMAMEATFIVEMMNVALLPDEPAGSTGVAPFAVAGGIVVSATRTDPAAGRLAGRHLEITDSGVISRPWLLRLLDHVELDARADRHGLSPIERHGSWRADRFTEDSHASISVYRPMHDPTG